MDNLESCTKLKDLILLTIEKEISGISDTYFNVETWRALYLNKEIPNPMFEYYSKSIDINFQSELYRVVKNSLAKELNKATNLKLKKICERENINLETGPPKYFLSSMFYGNSELPKQKREYVPNIVFQASSNTLFQILIGEIKTDPKLTYFAFKNAINQISKTIDNHNFQFGLFLIINNESNRIKAFKELYERQRTKRNRKQHMLLQRITIINFDSINKDLKIIN